MSRPPPARREDRPIREGDRGSPVDPQALRYAEELRELYRHQQDLIAQSVRYAEELRELYENERARTKELEAGKRALEDAVARMLRAERVRDEFIANCSHELRTPLTPIIGWADTLKHREGFSPAEVRRFADIISRNGRRLLEVVDSLLLVASIEDRAGAPPGPADTNAALERAAETALLAGRPVEVTVGLGAESVAVEPRTLRELLRRLVDNAIKFTPEGSPVALAASRRNGELAFTVADRGPGVPAADRDRIFESFAQGDASSTREHGGLGVGLYICRELARARGGRIWVEDTPGGGATFVFTIPSEGPGS